MAFHQIQKGIKRISAKKAIYYLNFQFSSTLFSPPALHRYIHLMKKIADPYF